MPQQSEAQQRKVAKVMHKFKEGDLKSSSGDKVRSRQQAIAIALSEAGVSKKSVPKKTGGQKAAETISRIRKAAKH